jgi:hypothetical protein
MYSGPDHTSLSRGKRLAFQNPHFGVPKNTRSMLQPEHPDFSPSEDCTPRRLFGPPHKAKAKKHVSTAPRRSPSPVWGGDGEDDDALAVPPRASLAQEFERIGKADGKKLLSPVKEGKDGAEMAAMHREDSKAMTTGPRKDNTPNGHSDTPNVTVGIA